MADRETLKTLIITDTSGKAKALKKFLGKSYLIISTDGFLKDMPKTKIGVDENYQPNYITVRGKGPILSELKRESLKARKVFFAMNPDGEGEFLADQCCGLFGVNEKSRCRLIIDEMTKVAVKKSLENAQPINKNLVDSFQAKQIIDKVVSHKIGEYLACKIYRGVKVGRSRALLLKIIAGNQPDGKVEFQKKFTLEVLEELSLRNLNFSTTKTRLILQELFEGLSLEKNNFAGLIKFPRGEEIALSSENKTPEIAKEFLNKNQFSLYELIYKKISGEELENNFELDGVCSEKSLMASLDALKIDWAEFYSASLSSLAKRTYISKDEGILKITDLGKEVSDALAGYFDEVFSVESYKKLSEQFAEISVGKIDKNSVIKNYLSEFEKSFAEAWKSLGENPQPKDEPDQPSEEICEKCGRPMIIKRGRFGRFLACSGYPDCKNTKPLMNYIEKKCPKCGGRLTKRIYKGGRIFYGCENFKTCDFTSWDEPQEKLCRVCGSTMFAHRFKDRAPMFYCGNENCSTREGHPVNKILEDTKRRYEEKKLRREKNKKSAATEK